MQRCSWSVWGFRCGSRARKRRGGYGDEGMGQQGERSSEVFKQARASLSGVRAIACGVSEIQTLPRLFPEAGA